ncbi:hypothetical protein SK224_08065 [Microbacterium sp. BG28]|uniref:hypothetical protein n=1 Tax=Microbacterium sp. BG28 TaxID=3097356 RepID=UPI002A5A3448|nr:hypothetical protein [Microbacterium sp. BG28]MDY0829082.1 hypothetical protein [Microbacterium sp. BG28]
MSTFPQTPVHFPRMKVRGKRNRAKLVPRVHVRQVLYGTIQAGFDGARPGEVVFVARNPATHQVELVQWQDGYGRNVPGPRTPRARYLAPTKKPSPFLGVTLGAPIAPSVIDLLFGRERAMNAT